MGKKYIDIMDTTFRDGFQSVFGGRVLMNDFLEHLYDLAINHSF
jgi:pyruvate carboxylase subunit B